MLEITPDHIAELADDDLRTICGLLCEAELARRGLPVSGVTWGGNQRAADGGLDVRVSLPAGSAVADFVPRSNTGFQVKCQDMPRAAILEEMRPSGVLRPVIRELADVSGAYVIASSQGSTADSAPRNRRAAMAEAVAGLQNAEALTLDFYDRTRLASWVRQHPGLIPWVRDKIGKPLRGWHSYGSWAYEPEGTEGEFLFDDTPRIQTGQKDDGEGLSTLGGIARMRDVLREPGTVVRLIGSPAWAKRVWCRRSSMRGSGHERWITRSRSIPICPMTRIPGRLAWCLTCLPGARGRLSWLIIARRNCIGGFPRYAAGKAAP
jgi:hypothetical protein